MALTMTLGTDDWATILRRFRFESVPSELSSTRQEAAMEGPVGLAAFEGSLAYLVEYLAQELATRDSTTPIAAVSAVLDAQDFTEPAGFGGKVLATDVYDRAGTLHPAGTAWSDLDIDVARQITNPNVWVDPA